MRQNRLSLCTLLSFFALVPLGCGEADIIPCGGLITLDGKPLADAAVMFSPADGRRPATGKTDEKGRFKLTTFKPDDGALTGEHKVTITAVALAVPPSGSAGGGGEEDAMMVDETDQPKLKWRAPQRYSRRETSGLSATVGSEDHFEFELTSK